MQLRTRETEDTKKERNDNHGEPAIGKNATLEVEQRLSLETSHSDSDGEPKDNKRKKKKCEGNYYQRRNDLGL